jgi:hypothetical protein
MTRARLKSLLVVAALAGVGACTTPSLPLPPPEPEAMTFALDTVSGTATYRSSPQPAWAGALVLVWDDRTGSGVITTADAEGAVAETAPFDAAEGDRVFVEYRSGEDQTSAICLILRDGQASSSDLCP